MSKRVPANVHLIRGGTVPKKVERKLKRQARAKGFGKKRTNKYVYGTLRKLGWKPKKKKSK